MGLMPIRIHQKFLEYAFCITNEENTGSKQLIPPMSLARITTMTRPLYSLKVSRIKLAAIK